MANKHPVPTQPSIDQYAATFVGSLWAAIRMSGGTHPDVQDHHYFPGLFDPEWLAEVPLPIGDNRPLQQKVALVDGMEFNRPSDARALEEAYNAHARTRVYESVDTHTGGWLDVTTRYLSGLAMCQAACSIYESHAGDKTISPHWDKWYGVAVQMRGTKEWRLGEDAETGSQKPTVTMGPGDVLLLPQRLMHAIHTPSYSVHINFALIIDEPIEITASQEN